MRKVNLVPMAGQGQRFIDAGYNTPKPLIDIDGIPMIINAAKSLPKADKWIFVCRKEHITNFNIDEVLINYFPNSIVLNVDQLTEGQVMTCLIAENHIRKNDQLVIGACDNSMNYKIKNHNKLINQHDAIIWTFRNNDAVLKNPEMYGWVIMNQEKKVTGISCKTAISDRPQNDHAIVGAFTFKKASTFIKYARLIITKNRKINNEFYLDILLDECVKNHLKVGVFEVDDYYCWGTPADLEKYKGKINE